MHIALIGAELQEDLAVRYLRSAVETRGHDVTQIAFNDPREVEAAADRMAESHARLAGLSMVFTSRAEEFVELAARARERGFDGHITAGGHFAAFNAEALLRDVPAIDSVVIGEGEHILCNLAARLHDLPSVRGLVWRTHDGVVVRNPPASKPPDLDVLPWPTRRTPFDDYLGLPIANMLGSRGCSHACSFCSISAWHRMCGGARLRLRSPEHVAEEMAALFAEGVRIFNFHDDNFILPNRRLMLDRIDRLRRALDKHGVGRIAFAIKGRPDEIDRDLLARLVEMGLFRIFLGVEAGTAEALVQLGRGQLLTDNERALAVTGELDLHACFNLLLWNPGSTLADVALNVAWLREHPDNPMNFSRTEVYAGTPLEQQLRDAGRLLGDYWGYDYRIADPGAEESFWIARAAFEERNFGFTSLHHTAMRLDYEYHLFAHFHGRDEGLRRRVKDFVRTVNLDTHAQLSRIVGEVARGCGDRAGFRARMIDEVTRRDRELDAVGQRILGELHQAATSATRTDRAAVRPSRATAAALAAALTMGAPACASESDGAPQPTQAAPPPVPPPAPPPPAQLVPVQPQTPPAQLVPAQPQPPPVADRAAPELGRPEAVRRQFDRRALRHLVRGIRPPRDTIVELTVAPDGRVTEATVRADGLTAEAQARIAGQLTGLTLTGVDVVGRRFVLQVTAADLRAATPQAIQAVPIDMITHPREAAHRPMLDEDF